MKKFLDFDLFVKETGQLKRINTADILFIEAQKDYVRIHGRTRNLTTFCSMKKILAALPEKRFVQVHRGFIVRIDQISEIPEGRKYITIGTERIPIGNTYQENIDNKLYII